MKLPTRPAFLASLASLARIMRPAALHMTSTHSSRVEPILREPPLVVALLPAAGRGLRMGGSVPKQFLSLGGEPLIIQSLRILQAASVVDQIILAVPPADVEYCEHEIVSRHRFTKVTRPEDLVIGAAILASRMRGSGTGEK